jgi:glycosyltransferase involved in cell wall biosynthesis
MVGVNSKQAGFNMRPKVSVILPCYNHVRYVEDSVNSILNQTYRDFELIIIDNCSDDGTRDLVKSLEKKDQRIRAFYHTANVGLAASINEGFTLAKGELIALTSSDDMWRAIKLEEQLAVLEKENRIDIVHSDAEIIDSSGKKTGKNIRNLYHLRPADASGNLFKQLTRNNVCCTSTILFRRRCLDTCGKFDDRLGYAHDWWFYINLSKKHRFYYIPQVLVSYRIHETNLTRNLNLVYNDYWLIHTWLADMGVDPKHHLISAAYAAAVLGRHADSVSALRKARQFGKLGIRESAIAFMIENFKGPPKLLLSLNKARRGVSGLEYEFNAGLESAKNYLRR